MIRKLAVVLVACVAATPGTLRAGDSPAAVTAPREHQGVLTPSAITQPAGTLAVDLTGFMPGVTLAPVDFAQLQIAGFLVPRGEQVDY